VDSVAENTRSLSLPCQLCGVFPLRLQLIAGRRLVHFLITIVGSKVARAPKNALGRRQRQPLIRLEIPAISQLNCGPMSLLSRLEVIDPRKTHGIMLQFNILFSTVRRSYRRKQHALSESSCHRARAIFSFLRRAGSALLRLLTNRSMPPGNFFSPLIGLRASPQAAFERPQCRPQFTLQRNTQFRR